MPVSRAAHTLSGLDCVLGQGRGHGDIPVANVSWGLTGGEGQMGLRVTLG